jgi:hypothetical protein
LIENPEHLIDHRRVAELTDLQVTDWRVGHLATNDLVHLHQCAAHGELQRLR